MITEQTEFQNYINRVSVQFYPQVKQRIIKECEVTPATFSYWRNGKINPSVENKIIINKIVKKNIFTII
jgi:hypothetical protein